MYSWNCVNSVEYLLEPCYWVFYDNNSVNTKPTRILRYALLPVTDTRSYSNNIDRWISFAKKLGKKLAKKHTAFYIYRDENNKTSEYWLGVPAFILEDRNSCGIIPILSSFFFSSGYNSSSSTWHWLVHITRMFTHLAVA